MKYIPLPFILLFCLLQSCDPLRRIEIKNTTADTAEVIWTSIEDSIGFNPFVISNSREMKFVVPPHKNSTVAMSFGLGTWKPAEVEKVIGLIESFEIRSSAHRIKIDSLNVLRDYLLARRKGIGGSKIQIVIR